MAAQVENVDAGDILNAVLEIQGEVRTKFDKLSEQFAELKSYVVEAKAYERAYNLPARIEDHNKRITTLEHAQVEGRELPSRIVDHELRLKTVEALENERRGRRVLFEWVAGAGALVALLVGVIEIYRFLKGH